MDGQENWMFEYVYDVVGFTHFFITDILTVCE